MKNIRTFLVISITSVVLNACKKDEPAPIPVDSFSSRQLLLSDIATNVISATYRDLNDKSITLGSNIDELIFSATDENLNICKADWKVLKSVWAQTEGFAFGPVVTENAVSRMNAWPLNKNGIDSILATSVSLTISYVNSISGDLKGLQAIEYMLFGANGNKVASELTQRELSFLSALIINIQSISAKLALEWKTDSSVGYFKPFVYAGDGSGIYSSQITVFELLANSMIGLADRIGGNVAIEQFNLTNQNLEEIPYSANSIKIFKDNIQGIKNIYIGSYLTDGKGLEDFIVIHNTALNTKIKQQLDEALAALAAITDPFGIAITTQATQIQTAVSKVNLLKSSLKDEMLPLIKSKIS
jgi:putative iron-regulated protein